MKEEIIKNINGLHDIHLSYAIGHVIYRGVSDISHELISRFGRSMIINKELREGSDYSYVVGKKTEIGSLDSFKKLSFPYLSTIPENDWEWMALSQHYGLPTRMMDWTTSILVAAFFACEHEACSY